VIASSYGVMHVYGGLTQLPRLTERERDAVVAAVDCGELVAVVDVQPLGGSPIVAVVTPEHVERFCAESDEAARTRLYQRLRELSDELKTLTTIVGEVMAEREPRDFRHRILDCVADAETILDRAIDASEELT
jgi:hypothetical protein